MPRSVAAGISMLSVPNPDVDTTTSSFPASSTSAVTRSGVRTHKARAPYKTCLISSTLLLSTTTTSAPPSASISWPAGSYIDLQRTTFPLDTAAMLPQPLSALNDNADDPFSPMLLPHAAGARIGPVRLTPAHIRHAGLT